MADHVRKQIRQAVATLLTGLATTGARVHVARPYPLEASGLPALVIDTPRESREAMSMGGANRLLERVLELHVRVVVRGVSGFRDTADQICKEVEVAIAGDNGLGGVAKHVSFLSMDSEVTGEGEQPVCEVTMVFEVLYVTALNAPDAPL